MPRPPKLRRRCSRGKRSHNPRRRAGAGHGFGGSASAPERVAYLATRWRLRWPPIGGCAGQMVVALLAVVSLLEIHRGRRPSARRTFPHWQPLLSGGHVSSLASTLTPGTPPRQQPPLLKCGTHAYFWPLHAARSGQLLARERESCGGGAPPPFGRSGRPVEHPRRRGPGSRARAAPWVGTSREWGGPEQGSRRFGAFARHHPGEPHLARTDWASGFWDAHSPCKLQISMICGWPRPCVNIVPTPAPAFTRAPRGRSPPSRTAAITWSPGARKEQGATPGARRLLTREPQGGASGLRGRGGATGRCAWDADLGTTGQRAGPTHAAPAGDDCVRAGAHDGRAGPEGGSCVRCARTEQAHWAVGAARGEGYMTASLGMRANEENG